MLTPARHFRPIPARAIRVAVPDTTQQTAYSCGASCLQAICKFYGVGPDDEWEFVRALRPDHRLGSEPESLQRAAKRFGLRFQEYAPMTIPELKAELRLRHPVLLIAQAWGRERRGGRFRRRRDYRHAWRDGHWLIAIGFDRDAIYFEDPSLQAVRGYLRIAELEMRWHHSDHDAVHQEHHGLPCGTRIGAGLPTRPGRSGCNRVRANHRMKLTSSAIRLWRRRRHRTSARSLARTRLGPQLMRGR